MKLKINNFRKIHHKFKIRKNVDCKFVVNFINF